MMGRSLSPSPAARMNAEMFTVFLCHFDLIGIFLGVLYHRGFMKKDSRQAGMTDCIHYHYKSILCSYQNPTFIKEILGGLLNELLNHIVNTFFSYSY